MRNHLVLAVNFSISIVILASFKDAKKEVSGKVDLGRLLFFDPILSRDGSISCASCHKPAYAFSDAVTDAAKRGFAVFNGKGKCIQCHFGADFTMNEFRNIGLFNGKNLNDSGRAVISGLQSEVGKFKIPSLRNVAITAPYMHNGMFKTLGEVVDFYNEPGKTVPDATNRDSILSKPLGLSKQEKVDLEAFLMSLTDKRFTTH